MSYAPYIAAHRFGLGTGSEDARKIANNPKAWLKNQLRVNAAPPLPGNFKSTDDLTRDIAKLRQASNEEKQKSIKNGLNIFRNEMEARFQQAVTSDSRFIERLVLFWSNHFTVSAKGKAFLAGIVGAFEREAIRPHILGKFSDLLLAVTQHPAMLVYLDNVQSFGPNSRAGKRRGKGLNENLAREILELHTLGVDGGYSQQDVIGLAKIITGWTVKPPRFGGGGFQFVNFVHEPGTHRLLGKTYSQKGHEQGVAALRDLASHPSTAKFIATKLARHFIADNPPVSAIRKLERTFLQTGGDLRALSQTLITMKEVWQHPTPKIKTPYEMVVGAFRLADVPANKMPFRRVMQSLGLLDHVPFQAPSPAGWGDVADDWLSPNSIMNRVEWCHAFAQIIRPQDNPLDLAKLTLGGAASPETLLWIERAPTPTEGLALLLASPEGQRR